MKNPKNCKNLAEIRREIDATDREIIKLIAERLAYAKASSVFKKTVRDEVRIKKVISSRKKWAQKRGVNPKVIAAIYLLLIDYFVKEQKRNPAKKS
jgi:isochorismate pyruvate lyase